jgi:hypothetical protein
VSASRSEAARRANDIKIATWSVLLVCLGAPFFLTMRTPPTADFAYFYGSGVLLNRYPAERLYDYELQKTVFEQVQRREFRYGPNPYHPAIAMIFRPIARLPYRPAYWLWTSITLAMFTFALHVLDERFLAGLPNARAALYPLALSFSPFYRNVLLNGHLTGIGFLAFALALRDDDRERRFRSGLWLSVCVYKPTLLLLVLPMLAVTRKWRTIAGFATGAAASALLVTAMLGPSVWRGYIEMMFYFGRFAASATQIRPWNYVDFKAFVFSMVPGASSWAKATGVALLTAPVLVLLFLAWRRPAAPGKQRSTLLWSTTLTWSLLLNFYVGFYDSTLILISIISMIGLQTSLPRRKYKGATLLACLVLVVSWVSQPIAQAATIQLMTFAIAAFGSVQLSVCLASPKVDPSAADGACGNRAAT